MLQKKFVKNSDQRPSGNKTIYFKDYQTLENSLKKLLSGNISKFSKSNLRLILAGDFNRDIDFITLNNIKATNIISAKERAEHYTCCNNFGSTIKNPFAFADHILDSNYKVGSTNYQINNSFKNTKKTIGPLINIGSDHTHIYANFLFNF